MDPSILGSAGCILLRSSVTISTPTQEFRNITPRLGNRKMATSSKIRLEASQQLEFYFKGFSSDTADTASELLQENHEKYHVFFNRSGSM